MECPIINPALSLLMKHLVIGQRQKLPISRLFIGHYTVVWFLITTRVVHLPKRTETSLITESDRSGPNHRNGSGCAGPE